MAGSQRSMTAPQMWVLALSSVASLMVAVDALVVTTALPVIRAHLHASLTGLEWTVNAYVLSLAVLLMTGAALGDRPRASRAAPLRQRVWTFEVHGSPS